MERVETHFTKTPATVSNGATAEQLLLTTQMLQHELVHLQANKPTAAKGSVVVSMPLQAIPTSDSTRQSHRKAQLPKKERSRYYRWMRTK